MVGQVLPLVRPFLLAPSKCKQYTVIISTIRILQKEAYCMKLTWLGHSCFILESAGFRLLTDPFEHVRGLADTSAEADAVYCSHDHFDHAYTRGVRLTNGNSNPFSVQEISSFHDDQQGALRGQNTIRRFEAEGISVVHLGDLGCPLNPAQINAIGRCDVLLLPIGGTYTVGPQTAKQVADSLSPRIILPMHYRQDEKGFEELCTLEEFAQLYPPEFVRRYDSSSLTIPPELPAQLAVLKMP